MVVVFAGRGSFISACMNSPRGLCTANDESETNIGTIPSIGYRRDGGSSIIDVKRNLDINISINHCDD